MVNASLFRFCQFGVLAGGYHDAATISDKVLQIA
jgi:hypothetical protein